MSPPHPSSTSTALCVAVQTARFQKRAFIVLLAGDGDLTEAFNPMSIAGVDYPFELALPMKASAVQVSYLWDEKTHVRFDLKQVATPVASLLAGQVYSLENEKHASPLPARKCDSSSTWCDECRQCVFKGAIVLHCDASTREKPWGCKPDPCRYIICADCCHQLKVQPVVMVCYCHCVCRV